jgi:preprotein translocase subunit YajC
MFTSPAYAQAAAEPASIFTSMFPLIAIFGIFYFLLIRPQQKKVKEHKAMLEAVRRGDRIVTNGGIVGLVTKVLDEERALMVEIADDLKVKVMRDMVSTVMSKTEPVSAEKADAGNADKDK